MMIRVTSTKTIKYKERVLEIPIKAIPGSKFCAVYWLRAHFARFPAGPDDPLFFKEVNGKRVVIKYKEVLAFLKRMSKVVGKDPSTIGLHSLRRAGSYYMHQLGVPLEDIKCVGDWRSLAALMYLILPLDRKLRIDEVVADSLSHI